MNKNKIIMLAFALVIASCFFISSEDADAAPESCKVTYDAPYGHIVATKTVGTQTTALKNGASVDYGTSITFRYEPSDGHQFLSWTKDGHFGTGDAVYELTAKSDVAIGVNLRYYSPSDSVDGITDIKMPSADEQLYMKWTREFASGQGGMSFEDCPSVPLIVDGNVYVRTGTKLIKMDIETGVTVKSVASVQMTGFYHYLGYGDGVIVDFTSKKAYDLDLDEKYALGMTGAVTAAFYCDGHFYVGSDNKLFKVDSATGAAAGGAWANGIPLKLFSSFGTLSAPVFHGGHMYTVGTDAKKVLINCVNLETGAVASAEVASLEGYSIDDGWLTYYNNGGSDYLFLTGYKSGLFDTATSTSAVASVKIGADGIVAGSEKKILIGVGGIGIPAGGATSAFQVLNGRGYLNVSVPSGDPSGWLMVFDAAMFLDTDQPASPDAAFYSQFLIYKEDSKAAHGSIVVSTGHLVDTGKVYIYLLPYKSADQAVYVFTDYVGKLSPSGFAKSVKTGSEFCSQAVRAGPNGELIWYSDDKALRCYASSSDVKYRFLIQDSGGMEWLSASANSAEAALESILSSKNIQYTNTSGAFSIDGAALNVFANDGKWTPVEDMSDVGACMTFFASTVIADMSSGGPEGTFHHRNGDSVGTATFAMITGNPAQTGRFAATPFNIVVYDANGGNGPVPVDMTEYRSGNTTTVLFDPAPTWTNAFAGWSTEANATDATYTAGGTKTFVFGNGNVTLYAVYASDSWNFRFDLGGKAAGKYLGDNKDYGGIRDVTVAAANPRAALIAAAESAYGSGSITLSGDYISTIHGMSGFGGSISSEQDSWGYGDIYYYPVQYVKENEAWSVMETTIAGYTGGSKNFAVVFQPLTFDSTAIEHTFDDAAAKEKYEGLKADFAWAGWGSVGTPMRQWSFHFDLCGTTAGRYLGDNKDYGGIHDVTFVADDVKNAFIGAATQAYGENSLVLTSSGWITTINDMNGSGGSIRSSQANGYDDIYYYPVQYARTGTGWASTTDPIAAYSGDSRTFAVVFQPLTFDMTEVNHTFSDDADAGKYNDLKRDFSWAGWGSVGGVQHAIAVTCGGNGSVAGNIRVSSGGSATFAISPADNYVVNDVKIDGISVGPKNAYTFSDVNGDHAIEADFTANSTKYTVTFGNNITVKNGNDNVASGSEVAPGTVLTVTVEQQTGKTATLTKTGTAGELPSLIAIGNVDLSVEYTTNVLKVTFKPENGGEDIVKTVDYGGTVKPPSVGKAYTATTAYDFSGWLIQGTGNVFTATTAVIEDLTVTAIYNESPRQYKLEYNANTGKGDVPTTAKYAYGSVAEIDFSTHPTKTSDFLGWDTDKLAARPKYKAGGETTITITENTKLYAIYGMESWTYYIDLGGKIAGHALGDGKDYGGAHSVTVRSNHPESAFTTAVKSIYGPNSITISSSGSIKKINGMDGNGDDIAYAVYFYPIHYSLEGGVWTYMANESVANYTGESRSFALVFQPYVFSMGGTAIASWVNKYGNDTEIKLYAWLKEVFNWDGENNLNAVQHIITGTAGDGGQIGPFSEMRAFHGKNATLTIVPDSGCIIKDVLVDGTSVGRVDSYTFENVAADHTISAEFISATVPHKVEYNANFGSGDVPETATYSFADTITVDFTKIPSSVTNFLGWSADRYAAQPEYADGGTSTFTITKETVTLYAIYANSEWQYRFDLGGKIAGKYLGDNKDYGAPHTVTVTANNPMTAFKAATESVYGAGSLVVSSDGWITTINGMNGSGGSISSKQDSWGYGDIYYYPVQYVKGASGWKDSQTPIAAYAGSSREFAVLFQPLTFDLTATDHTFADAGDARKYDGLKKDFSWAGWGTAGMRYVIEVTAGNGGKVEPGTIRVPAGADAVFAFEPNSGYKVGNVLVNGSSKGAVAGYTFAAVASDQTLSVSFAALPVESSITVTPGTLSLAGGGSAVLTAVLSGGSGTVSWTSSNSNVASVDQNGKVTAVSAGTATITASARIGGSSVSATCSVTVSASSASLALDAASLVMYPGDSAVLTATSSAAWSSSDSAVVTVDQSGRVAAVSAGTAKITAVSGTYRAECSVSVLAKGVSAVEAVSASGGYSATIPASTLGGMSGKEVSITSSVAKVSFSPDAVSGLSGKGGNLRVDIKAVDKSGLNESQREKVGDGTVISISATIGAQQIHKIGGKATIAVPYVLKSGDDPKNIKVFFMSDSGALEEFACSFDALTGMVTFETDHFSYYFLKYVDEPSGGNTMAIVMIAVIAVIALMAAAALMARRKVDSA